jgi:hypothetical protein
VRATALPGRVHWLIPVLIVVVSLTVGGGLLAREFYQAPRTGYRTQATSPSPRPTSLAPHQQPGSARVRLSADAAAHPRAEPVRKLLQAYFNAINTRDYNLWSTTVVTARIKAQPRQEWLSNYGTTKDGSIVVYRIDAAPEKRLTVLLGFTSTQAIADAPPELPRRCIRWHLALPLVREYGGWKVANLPAGTTPQRSAC